MARVFWNCRKINLTRMHSSRMRTARSSSHLLGGGARGVCLSACWDPPWVWAWRPPSQIPQLPPLVVGLKTWIACWKPTHPPPLWTSFEGGNKKYESIPVGCVPSALVQGEGVSVRETEIPGRNMDQKQRPPKKEHTSENITLPKLRLRAVNNTAFQ